MVHAAIAVCGLALAVALGPQAIWAGVLLGALLGGLNFRALALLAARFTRTDDNAGRSGAMGLIIVKMAVMMAAVAGIMTFAQPDVGAFLGGISLSPLALVAVSAVARPTFADTPTFSDTEPAVSGSHGPEVQG